MPNKLMKHYQPLGEWKLNTMKYHSTPIKMAKICKIVTMPDAGKDAEKPDHSHTASGNAK